MVDVAPSLAPAAWSGLDFSEFVPEVYAAYRPILVDALGFFLEHLSPRRMELVVRGQVDLPDGAEPARRLVRFLRFCPALHKLGQVLARHRELDRSLRQRLQRLETMAPRTPVAEVEPAIRADLGAAVERWGIELADAALAEGSVAVVVPVDWRESARGPRRRGVLKVLKPGAAADLREDLALLARVADYLDERREHYDLPTFAYRDAFDEVRELLLHEIDHEREQANLAAAARRFFHRRDVWIPALLPFSTQAVTAMERIDGVKATDLPHRSARAYPLGRTIADALLGDVLFTTEPSALFHADPHAGNLVAASDGRLGVLDWSLTGQLGAADRVNLMSILVGALTADAARIARAIVAMATERPPEGVVRGLVRAAMGRLGGSCVPGMAWLMELLDSLGMAGVRFGGDLLLLRKTYFMLEGVIADICPDWPLETLVLSAGIERVVSEWPGRAWRPLGARDYPTGISTIDLIRIGAAAPFAMAGCWVNRWLRWAGTAAGG